MTAAEIAAYDEAEKEAEKRAKLLNQRQQHQQAMGIMPPSPSGAPPPPPFLAKGAKIPAKKITAPVDVPAEYVQYEYSI